MPDVVQPAMHGRDHCPGGSDEIPCLRHPRAVLAEGAGDIADTIQTQLPFLYAGRYDDEDGDFFTWTDAGGFWELNLVQHDANRGGRYQLECFVGWDNDVVGTTVLKIECWDLSANRLLPMVDVRNWDGSVTTDLFNHVVGQVDTRPFWFGDGGWIVKPLVYHTDASATRGFNNFWLKAEYIAPAGPQSDWVEEFMS